MGAIATRPQGSVGNILGPGEWDDRSVLVADGDDSNAIAATSVLIDANDNVSGMNSLDLDGPLDLDYTSIATSGNEVGADVVAANGATLTNALTLIGLYGEGTFSGSRNGQTCDVYGLYGYATATTDAGGNLVGADVTAHVGATQTGDAYGLRVFVTKGAFDTLPTGYGIYVDTVQGTTTWAFYNASGAAIYAGGDVSGVGTLTATSITDGTATLTGGALTGVGSITISEDGWVGIGAAAERVEFDGDGDLLKLYGTVTYVDGNLGIGTTTVPHGGNGMGKLVLHGTDASVDGPHLQFTTSADDYPLVQFFIWQHDHAGIMFDSYYELGGTKSSSSAGNFFIHKNSGRLNFKYDDSVAQGAAVSYSTSFYVEGDGSVTFSPAAPLKTYWRDSGIYIYSAADGYLDAVADTGVRISTGGAERVEFGTSEVVFNDGGADYNFRVEGDTKGNLFLVDAGNDRVGIGNPSPNHTLGIRISDSTVYSSASLDYDGAEIYNTDTTANAGCALYFKVRSADTAVAGISCISPSSTHSELAFQVETSGVIGEIMRVNGDGVQIASTQRLYVRDSGLSIYSAADSYLDYVADGAHRFTGSVGIGCTPVAGTTLDVNGALSVRTELYFTEADGTRNDWQIQYSAGSTALLFTQTGVATRVAFKDGGNVGIGITTPQSILHINASTAPAVRISSDGVGGGVNSTFYGLATASNHFLNGSVAGDTVLAAKSGGTFYIGTSAAAAVSTKRFAIDPSGYAVFGSGATSHSLSSAGDVLVSGKLEVDSYAYFDGSVEFYSTVSAYSASASRWLYAETGVGYAAELRADYSTDQFVIGIHGTIVDYAMIITAQAYSAKNHDRGTQSHPTTFWFAAANPDETNNKWGSLHHDGTGFVLTSGAETGAGSSPATIDNYIRMYPRGTLTFELSGEGSVVCGAQAALATNATDGFLYIPTCAGVPTGTPTSYTGKVALVFDTTNNDMYVYDGSWIKVALS